MYLHTRSSVSYIYRVSISWIHPIPHTKTQKPTLRPYLTNPIPLPQSSPSPTPSLTPPNPSAKLPNLINLKPRAPRLRILGEDDKVRVGPGVQRALDPAEREHGCGRSRDGLEGLRDAGAGPLD